MNFLPILLRQFGSQIIFAKHIVVIIKKERHYCLMLKMLYFHRSEKNSPFSSISGKHTLKGQVHSSFLVQSAAPILETIYHTVMIKMYV